MSMKNIILWRCAAIMIICAAFLTSCSDDDETTSTRIPPDEVEAQLSQMTLREKVGQLFYVRPEALDTTIKTANLAALKLQVVNETMLDVNEKYPVGGIVLYAHNINDESQLTNFIEQIR